MTNETNETGKSRENPRENPHKEECAHVEARALEMMRRDDIRRDAKGVKGGVSRHMWRYPNGALAPIWKAAGVWVGDNGRSWAEGSGARYGAYASTEVEAKRKLAEILDAMRREMRALQSA